MNDSVKTLEAGAEAQVFEARIVPGHQVASGRNGDPRFPGGTIRMQTGPFRELGMDLSSYHPGTLNISIAPLHYRIVAAPRTLRAVKWHPTEPEEDFSFFDVELLREGQPPVQGLIYYPHPDTKPEHFQQPDVLELLLPYVEGLDYGSVLLLRTPASQMVME